MPISDTISSTSDQALNGHLTVERNDVSIGYAVPCVQLEEQPACVPDAETSDINERIPSAPSPRYKRPLRIELTADPNAGAPEAFEMSQSVAREAVTRTLISNENTDNLLFMDSPLQQPDRIVR